MEFVAYLPDLRRTHRDLASQIEKFVTLESVLNWLNAEGYPLASLDMVTQDEYCHDLLIPRGNEWLVFGMT